MSGGAAGAAGAGAAGIAAPDVAFDDAQPALCRATASDSEASGNAIHRAPERRCNDSGLMSETPFWV